MQFPVYLKIGQYRFHPHLVFELIAYVAAFRLYLFLRKKSGDTISDDARWWVLAAAVLGAAIGSKALFWLEDPGLTIRRWNDAAYLLSGKTIVGGLLGGWLAVEWTKQRLGVSRRTGDLFVLPLLVGIGIGRVGCFLTGVSDHTAGVHTSLPWGIDFGDGPRHPTQLYEIAFVSLFGAAIYGLGKRPVKEGDFFRLFLGCYLGFRFLIDFLKPDVHVLFGLSSIQFACLVAITYLVAEHVRDNQRPEVQACDLELP